MNPSNYLNVCVMHANLRQDQIFHNSMSHICHILLSSNSVLHDICVTYNNIILTCIIIIK